MSGLLGRLLGRAHAETYNEQLLREAGLERGDGPPPREPEREPESGPEAVAPTARDWPGKGAITVLASAPELRGDEVAFTCLADGSLVVHEQQGDASLEPRATAVEAQLVPPYNAQARAVGGGVWSIGATTIEVVDLPGFAVDDLTVTARATG